MVLRAAALLTVLVVLGVVVPAAEAGVTRYVSALPATPTGACLQADPCSLEHAWSQIASGDELVLAPGSYSVTSPLVASVAVTVRGAAGQVHPQVVGVPSLSGPTIALDGGGTLKHIAVGADATGQAAVEIDSGLVEDFSAVAADGPAVKVDGSSAGTTVRDAVLVSRSAITTTAALVLNGDADVALRNLTVWADGGPAGIDCDIATADASLVNVLVRGTTVDVDASTMGDRCTAKYSNYRPGLSPGVKSLGWNQSAAPLVGDTVAGDFRPRAGSPTIDAGTDDAQLWATDPDGVARKLGAATDIGAYEAAGPPKPEPDKPAQEQTTEGGAGHTPLDPLPPRLPMQLPNTTPPPPVLGKSVTLGNVKGDVRVRVPGGRFVDLNDAKSLPVGTIVDTRKGEITLSSALPGGKSQTGTFSGGLFEVRQARNAKGMTDILLRGAVPGRCKKRTARAAAKGKRSKSRRLWAKDKGGRFRTHGKNSVATVRGTRWLTEDRCDGTYTKVLEGAVDVRDKRTGKVRRVKAGKSLLVRR